VADLFGTVLAISSAYYGLRGIEVHAILFDEPALLVRRLDERRTHVFGISMTNAVK